jgi:surface polysaccharide O-acyltransferase-like enzyme
MPLVEVQGYVGYFIAGYYFSQYESSSKMKRLIYISGIFSLITTVVFTRLLSAYENKATGFFNDYLLLNTALAAFFIFILVKKYISRIAISEKNMKRIEYISNCTFGIYLIHPFFIDILHTSLIARFHVNLLSVPLLAVLYFVLSLLVSVVIKQMPVLNKYIV